MTDADVTRAIMHDLRDRHQDLIWAEELALSSGRRRCDFWVLHPYASKGYRAVAYEVKASRADFKRETRMKMKQREARLFSDEFYYVAPAGLIAPEELPDWAGLMEHYPSEETSFQRLKIKVPAPVRDKDHPTWELVVSIMRYSGASRRDRDLMRDQNARLKNALKKALKNCASAPLSVAELVEDEA